MSTKNPASPASDAPPSGVRRFAFDAAKLLAIAGLAAALSHTLFFHLGQVRERDYAINTQVDLIAIDGGKEQFAVDTGAKDGDPAPADTADMLKAELIGDPPRNLEFGEYAVNAIGKDPSFKPNDPTITAPLPLALPVEFSELSTEVEAPATPPQASPGLSLGAK